MTQMGADSAEKGHTDYTDSTDFFSLSLSLILDFLTTDNSD